MREQKITIEIDADGRITADAEGFSGDACIETLHTLLDELAGGVAQVERKPERGAARVTQRSTQTSGRKK